MKTYQLSYYSLIFVIIYDVSNFVQHIIAFEFQFSILPTAKSISLEYLVLFLIIYQMYFMHSLKLRKFVNLLFFLLDFLLLAMHIFFISCTGCY